MRRVGVLLNPAPPSGCIILCHPSTNDTDAVEATTSIVQLFLSRKGSSIRSQQQLNVDTCELPGPEPSDRTLVQDLLHQRWSKSKFPSLIMRIQKQAGN